MDKTKFHIVGAVLFTAQSALLHPTAVVKTRMQVAGSGLSHMRGVTVFRHILKNDGIPGLFRGFGTSAIGSLPGRVLALTSLEVSKDMMLKYTHGMGMPDATRVGLANGVAGLFSNCVSCVYYVPLDVVHFSLPFLYSLTKVNDVYKENKVSLQVFFTIDNCRICYIVPACSIIVF